jgi:FkbM family methyltransferase
MNIPEQTVRTTTVYGDFFVDPEHDQKLGNQLKQGKHPNAPLIALTKQYTDEKSIVLDVGAHIGTFAIPVSRFVARVVAFEPSPETFATLVRNAAQNNCSIDARNKALGAREGRGSLARRSATNAGAHSLVPGDDIAVRTLDQEVNHANFIKIDVEGMEAQVLVGGETLIEKSRPVVFFELNLSQLRAHGSSPRALARFFITRGYRLYLPMEKTEDVYELARVRGLTLITALIAPRAWLLHGESAPFDILAVPAEYESPYTVHTMWYGLASVIQNNLRIKMHRLDRFGKNYFRHGAGGI